MISSEYMKILACPECKGELLQTDSGTTLFCLPCGINYPIRGGIPVMLPDDAEKPDNSRAEAAEL